MERYREEMINTIDDLLKRVRVVTGKHLVEEYTAWSLNEQLLKIYEEVGELQKASSPLEALDEGSDIIYSVLTFWHLVGIDDYAIKEGLESTMKKIEERVKDISLKKGEVIKK